MKCHRFLPRDFRLTGGGQIANSLQTRTTYTICWRTFVESRWFSIRVDWPEQKINLTTLFYTCTAYHVEDTQSRVRRIRLVKSFRETKTTNKKPLSFFTVRYYVKIYFIVVFSFSTSGSIAVLFSCCPVTPSGRSTTELPDCILIFIYIYRERRLNFAPPPEHVPGNNFLFRTSGNIAVDLIPRRRHLCLGKLVKYKNKSTPNVNKCGLKHRVFRTARKQNNARNSTVSKERCGMSFKNVYT